MEETRPFSLIASRKTSSKNGGQVSVTAAEPEVQELYILTLFRILEKNLIFSAEPDGNQVDHFGA